MATALSAPRRLIEYPDDLTECRRIKIHERDLLYYLVQKEDLSNGDAIAVVVLGYKSGEKLDIVTKDLIETVGDDERAVIRRRIAESLQLDARICILFL